MLKSGINPEPVRGVLENPLEVACKKTGREAEKIVDLLLSHGAEGNENTVQIFPLLQACTWSDARMVKLLLEHDHTMLEQTNKFGENPLHCAAKNFKHGESVMEYLFNNFEIAYKLISCKDVNGTEPLGVNPCHCCKILSKLFTNGGDLNKTYERFYGYLPGLNPTCSGEKVCPMRRAQNILAKVGYIFNSNFMWELEHHEAYYQCTPELATQDVKLLEAEFKILDSEKMFGNKTLLQFLLASRSETNIFAKNKNIILNFLRKDKMKFYDGLIKFKLFKASNRLHLIGSSYEKFSNIIHMSLPLHIFENISIFFNDVELSDLIKVEPAMTKDNFIEQ